MPYIVNTDQDRKEMMEKIGVSKFEELLADIPEEFILKENLNLEKSSSELDVSKKLHKLAAKNSNTLDNISFLGGGSYDHYIPSVIAPIISRPEFLTSYTPYQAEVSQGTLQTIYEFQSMLCNLTGMDITNASMYDGATAMAEAILLACSQTKKRKVLIASTIAPVSLDVVRTYVKDHNIELLLVDEKDGRVPFEAFEKNFNKEIAAIIIQTPNFYGNIEDLEKLGELAHSEKCLFIVSQDPISLGLLKKPAEYDADIVVAEGQCLGLPQSFGGPYLGLFSATKKLMRKIPGRIVGATEDTNGDRGFVLTLQTREQHIRRSKATSNICTAQALCALSAGIYMATMGEEGFKEVAKNCYLGSHYLAKEISQIDGFELRYDAPFFKEFVIKTKYSVDTILNKMVDRGMFAGIPMSKFGKSSDEFLIAVTEKRNREEIDLYIKNLKEIISEM